LKSIESELTRFREYSPFFEPDELLALTFCLRCSLAAIRGLRYLSQSSPSCRFNKSLAYIIMASACYGEQSIDRLMGIALKARRLAK